MKKTTNELAVRDHNVMSTFMFVALMCLVALLMAAV